MFWIVRGLPDNGLMLSLRNDVAASQVRCGIFDFRSAAAANAMAELEQRGVIFRAAFWTGNGHGTVRQPKGGDYA